MGRITVPPDIERLFDKPGREWTEEEKTRVLHWLCEPRSLQFQLLARTLLRHLGGGATAADAEEAVFWLLGTRYDAIVRSYDPAKEKALRFGDYLLWCLGQDCRRHGGMIRQRLYHEQIQPAYGDDEEHKLEVVVPDDDPAHRPENIAAWQQFGRELTECIKALSNENHRMAFVLCVLQGRSYEQIAEEMGCPLGSVCGWVNRSRRQVAECLSKKGLV